MYDYSACSLFWLLIFFLHVCLLWILIAHLLQALLQMLAGLAWNDYQSQIPLASLPVTLLHGDGTRAGDGAETGAGAGDGLPGDRRQRAQEINTSTGASRRSDIQLQLEQRRWNEWLAMMSQDAVAHGSCDTVMPYLELTAGNHWLPLMSETQRWKHNFCLAERHLNFKIRRKKKNLH